MEDILSISNIDKICKSSVFLVSSSDLWILLSSFALRIAFKAVHLPFAWCELQNQVRKRKGYFWLLTMDLVCTQQ